MKGLSKGRYDETFAGEDVIYTQSTNPFDTEATIWIWTCQNNWHSLI